MRQVSLVNGSILDEICLQEFAVPCFIGIYPEEAVKTQILKLRLSLYLDTRAAAISGQLSQSVDYALLADEIRFILQNSRFGLLETAAEAILAYVLAPTATDCPRGSIESAELCLQKPEALSGTAMPSLRIMRHKKFDSESGQCCGQDVLFCGPEACLIRFVIPPHGRVETYLPGWQICALRTSGAGLQSLGKVWTSGSTILHEFGEGDVLINKAFEIRTVLAIGRRAAACEPAHSAIPAGGSLFSH